MKKLILIIGFCSLLSVIGCSKNSANRDVYEESGNTVNVNNKRSDLYNEGGSRSIRNVNNNYGFVRYQKSPVMGDNPANNHYTALNREQLANIISKYCTNIPNVNDVDDNMSKSNK